MCVCVCLFFPTPSPAPSPKGYYCESFPPLPSPTVVRVALQQPRRVGPGSTHPATRSAGPKGVILLWHLAPDPRGFGPVTSGGSPEFWFAPHDMPVAKSLALRLFFPFHLHPRFIPIYHTFVHTYIHTYTCILYTLDADKPRMRFPYTGWFFRTNSSFCFVFTFTYMYTYCILLSSKLVICSNNSIYYN